MLVKKVFSGGIFSDAQPGLLERMKLDEAQNLTSKQLKTLVSRAGPGARVVYLENIAQINTPCLTETTSGLTSENL